MNTNFFHNLLNLLFGLIGVLVLTDWTAFGVQADTGVQIVGALLVVQNVLKLIINVSRDGVTGLVKEQPPVR